MTITFSSFQTQVHGLNDWLPWRQLSILKEKEEEEEEAEEAAWFGTGVKCTEAYDYGPKK